MAHLYHLSRSSTPRLDGRAISYWDAELESDSLSTEDKARLWFRTAVSVFLLGFVAYATISGAMMSASRGSSA